MKFIVLSKPFDHGPVHLDPDLARAAKVRLEELMGMGIVEQAFVLEGGGSAYILSAPSPGYIMQAIRQNQLSLHSDIEVLPLGVSIDQLAAYDPDDPRNVTNQDAH